MNAESEKVIDELRHQVRFLENEIVGLRRSLPRLKDVDGKDYTDEVKFNLA